MEVVAQLGTVVALALVAGVIVWTGLRIERGLRELAEGFGRIEELLGTRSARIAVGAAAEERPVEVVPPSRVGAVHAALGSDDLVRAKGLIEALEGETDAATLESLKRALNERQEVEVRDLRASLEASRAASDPERVLELHGRLAPLISGFEREALEREQVRWFLGLLMRRLRTGTVRADVVHLAERVAEVFATHAEGASLRASLPTLRRSAGMCPVCGGAYTGIETACPECQRRKAAEAAPASVAGENPWDAEDGDEAVGEPASDDDRLLLDR